jgi:hypothetical protein
MTEIRNEVSVKCNNGTKFKIVYSPDSLTYILSYRNDEIPLLSVDGGKVKGKWI